MTSIAKFVPAPVRRLRQRLRGALGAFKPAPPPPFPMVSLVAWKSPRNVPNFGDDLSQVIVSLMLARRGRTLEDEAVRATSLLAIGSIIHFAPEGATLWGSGVNGKIPEHFHRYRGLDVRAVRGPYTREWLMRRKIAVPEIYGDPALLLPELCQGRFQPSGAGGTIFVPNLNDILAGTEVTLPAGVPLVSPMRSWHRVVADIVAARFVVASSLHGVVIAEAFGIPARYVRLSEHENLFKFQDYYAGTGRGSFAYARSIEEALEMGGEAAPVFDSAALKRAFPLDLWR